MTSIVLTGTDRIKSVIVIPDKAVSPFWVFPYPILKRLFDCFLFCLCRRGFLCVEYSFFVSVLIIDIIKNTGITEI